MKGRCLTAVAVGFAVTSLGTSASAVAEDYIGFTSPSGNIGCMLISTDVRCDIDERSWSPPQRPADCYGITDYGQGIALTAGEGPSFVCAGDTTLRQAPPLAYGQSKHAGALLCGSAASGMTCRDASTGHGFSLSRDGCQLF